jgi:hypothetical protein
MASISSCKTAILAFVAAPSPSLSPCLRFVGIIPPNSFEVHKECPTKNAHQACPATMRILIIIIITITAAQSRSTLVQRRFGGACRSHSEPGRSTP